MARQHWRIGVVGAVLFWTIAGIYPSPSSADQAQELEKLYVRLPTWRETMLAWRGRIANRPIEPEACKSLSMRVWKDFPVQWDWVEQDCGADFFKWLGGQADSAIEKAMIRRVLEEPGLAAGKQASEFEQLCASGAPSTDGRWLDLYEMDVETRQVRQFTFGPGFADYEGAYLPSGDIIFNSTRCVQTVDCWWTEVSNPYTCDKDGKYLRRLTFDQVHTNFPTVTDDGRVIYTRWDYNDRAQIYPQGLFQMNADGTGQSEYYGNKQYVRPYAIYLMAIDGRRELLAADPDISCNQPIPLVARDRPRIRPSTVDYRKKTATYYVQDVYFGQGLPGIARGTIKKLRVIALDFRAAGIGRTSNSGPGGGALASTPVGVGNACWDVKVVLGDATVYEDGSAMFTVPARTPVYFQALDANGHMVQTMRSWSTLQPGETFSCIGCHENKNEAPPVGRPTRAQNAGPQKLEPFYGPARGFSFDKEIQPILDRHCIECHTGREGQAFSLLANRTATKESKRRWSDSYLAMTDAKPVEKDGDVLY